MSSSLNFILDQVGKEKGIPKEILVEAIESAMVTASRKKLGPGRDIEAQFNEETGDIIISKKMEISNDNSFTLIPVVSTLPAS